MNETERVDLGRVRAEALERVKRGERRLSWIIAVVAVVEASGLLGFLLIMDFRDRLHWLMLVQALLSYGTLGVGLVALGAYVNLSTQRILKALSPRDEPGR